MPELALMGASVVSMLLLPVLLVGVGIVSVLWVRAHRRKVTDVRVRKYVKILLLICAVFVIAELVPLFVQRPPYPTIRL